MHRSLRRVLMVCGLVCILCGAIWLGWQQVAPATDQGATLQQRVLSIASQLRAPGDENTMTAASSNSAAAEHLKYLIQQELLQNKPKQQILSDLERVYGPSVYAVPQSTGFGITVWILPLLGLLLFAFGLFPQFTGRKRSDTTAGDRESEQSDASRTEQSADSWSEQQHLYL